MTQQTANDYSRFVGVKVSPRLDEQLRQQAQQRGVSLSALVRGALQADLQQQQPPEVDK